MWMRRQMAGLMPSISTYRVYWLGEDWLLRCFFLGWVGAMAVCISLKNGKVIGQSASSAWAPGSTGSGSACRPRKFAPERLLPYMGIDIARNALLFLRRKWRRRKASKNLI